MASNKQLPPIATSSSVMSAHIARHSARKSCIYPTHDHSPQKYRMSIRYPD
jgi:hypothetical protein